MTPQELLKPRYKIIAAYPHMALDQHDVGDIISPYGMGFVYPEKVREQYESYPHLFKRLEWWEERRPEDLPIHVKFIEDYWHYKIGEIVPVFNWYDYPNACIYHSRIGPQLFLPVSKEEYEQFLKDTVGQSK